MRRRLFTAGSVLSLILCLATLAMWVRSYVTEDYVHTCRPWTQNGVVGVTSRYIWSAHGTLGLNTVHTLDRNASHVDVLRWDQLRAGSYVPLGGFLSARYGIGFDRDNDRFLIGSMQYGVWEVAIRYWLLALLTAVLPLLRIVSRYGARERPGHCQQCGYDLRATPSRCPECGTQTAIPRVEADYLRGRVHGHIGTIRARRL